MKDQHEKIKGYRDLSEAEVKDVNTVKELAERVGELVESLSTVEGYDQRWIAIGRTHMQQGFMAVIRGVARPETF